MDVCLGGRVCVWGGGAGACDLLESTLHSVMPPPNTHLHVTVPARLQSVRRGRHRASPLFICAPAALQQVPFEAQHVPAATLVPLAHVEPTAAAEASDTTTAMIRSTRVAFIVAWWACVGIRPTRCCLHYLSHAHACCSRII